ncbi:MAG: GntR family transcriptional regulator [Hyphomonadaceae bacterium]|nr:GntR family transcriptional regulator [Hyphomonadaceae bacterium]
MQFEPISRANLSDAAEAAIRAMIVDGRLPADQRLNEVRLAERLGVSRTPLREALNRLVSEGAVEARPRLGYFVKPLTLAEFDQLYDIRPILDPAALRLAGLPDARRLDRLEKLNRAFADARTPEDAIAQDDAWHMELIAACPNTVLIDLIASFCLRTRRYELALMREKALVARARDDHDDILKALRDGDLDAACLALEHNMRSGKAAIVDWLRTRATGATKAKRS